MACFVRTYFGRNLSSLAREHYPFSGQAAMTYDPRANFSIGWGCVCARARGGWEK